MYYKYNYVWVRVSTLFLYTQTANSNAHLNRHVVLQPPFCVCRQSITAKRTLLNLSHALFEHQCSHVKPPTVSYSISVADILAFFSFTSAVQIRPTTTTTVTFEYSQWRTQNFFTKCKSLLIHLLLI